MDGCEIREIALDLADAAWDQRLLEGLQDVGQEIATVVLGREDEALREQVPAGWENLGRERRQLETLAGKVAISRRVYRDQQGVRHKPLDEALGLTAYRRGTQSLERIAAYLASATSYRRAAEQLGWTVGRPISATFSGAYPLPATPRRCRRRRHLPPNGSESQSRAAVSGSR